VFSLLLGLFSGLVDRIGAGARDVGVLGAAVAAGTGAVIIFRGSLAQGVALAAIDDAARVSLAGLIARSDLGADEVVWRQRADEADKLISSWTARRSVAEAVDALRAAGVAAARVTTAEALLSDPQLLGRGFWETVDHPVAGSFLCTGMPFAFVGKPRRWIHRAPPLYGQHTDEVLTGILGRSQQDLAELRASGVISLRPAGL